MPDDRPKRLQSQTERDLAGIAARRERHAAPAQGVPEFEVEEFTGRYEGEELAAMRKKRPTDERIGRLEEKHDSLTTTVNNLRVDVASIDGKLDVLPELVSLLKGKTTAEAAARADEHATKRLGMTNRTKIVLGILGVLGSGGIGALISALSGCA